MAIIIGLLGSIICGILEWTGVINIDWWCLLPLGIGILAQLAMAGADISDVFDVFD